MTRAALGPTPAVERGLIAPRRLEVGGLDLSLPPDLGQMLRAAAARLGDSPRLLALEILQAVLGGEIVDAVLDRG